MNANDCIEILRHRCNKIYEWIKNYNRCPKCGKKIN